MVQLRPISDALGMEVLGVDLAQPASPDLRAELYAKFNEHGVLLFRNQTLTKKGLVAASHSFGETALHVLENSRDSEVPEITVISTQGIYGNVTAKSDAEMVGRLDWHTDHAYIPTPNRGAVIYGETVPPVGGETGFVDRQKVYAALPERLKQRIEGLGVIQSWKYSQGFWGNHPGMATRDGSRNPELDRYPDLIYPLVYRHPENGEKILNIAPQWSAGIPGLSETEGRKLLDELIDIAVQPEFTYWHRYQPGDVVVWDNWREMHAASGTPGRHLRVMWRTTLKGTVEFGRLAESERGLAHAGA